MTPKIIFVEGNIGTGKTTFLKNLENDKYKIQKLYEPVDEWIKSGMLGKFYEDPDQYNLMFQTYCLFTRLKQYEKIDNEMDYVFIERSIFCDCNVFANMCLKGDTQKYDDYLCIYNQYLSLINEMYNHKNYFLYLQKDPMISLNQIKARGRFEEEGITIDYLRELHNYHERWLNKSYVKQKKCYFNKYCKSYKSEQAIICQGDYDVRNKECVNTIFEEIVKILT